MKKQLKKLIPLLSASLLVSSSVLASDAEQDNSFLKKDREESAPVLVTATPVEIILDAKPIGRADKYFAIEATYNFNHYKPYFIGKNTTYKHFQDSAAFGLGVGMFVDENFRSDAIFSYTLPTTYKFNSNSNTYNSRVTTTKLMLNGTYDFNRAVGGVSPYISAGIGAACNHTTTNVNLDGDNTRISGNYINFAYQVGAGLAYTMENQTILDIGYRFADNGTNKKIAGVANKRLQSHEILLGMKVPF